jgi:hypothetical protein
MTQHVTIWIDHKEARILRFRPESVDEATVSCPPQHVHHKHPKGPEGVKEHPDDTQRFFRDVGRALEGTEEILLVGPATAKLEFVRYLHKHGRAIESRIVAIETTDHPTDRQLVAHARTYFERPDRTAAAR